MKINGGIDHLGLVSPDPLKRKERTRNTTRVHDTSIPCPSQLAYPANSSLSPFEMAAYDTKHMVHDYFLADSRSDAREVLQ